MKKRVLLVGGRRKARSLALSLLKRGYQVTAVNSDRDDCRKLAELEKLNVICGDGTKPFVLEDAGAEGQDIAIALTPKDADNLVICELCKKRFHIRRTVALVSDPQKTAFFRKMGIDRVVCAISAITGIIEQQAFLEQMENVIPVGEGRVNVLEVAVPVNSPAAGKTLVELDLPREVIVGCVLRDDAVMIPWGDTAIWANDLLVLIVASGKESEAISALVGKGACGL